jgi:hypothetical protein
VSVKDSRRPWSSVAEETFMKPGALRSIPFVQALQTWDLNTQIFSDVCLV